MEFNYSPYNIFSFQAPKTLEDFYTHDENNDASADSEFVDALFDSDYPFEEKPAVTEQNGCQIFSQNNPEAHPTQYHLSTANLGLTNYQGVSPNSQESSNPLKRKKFDYQASKIPPKKMQKMNVQNSTIKQEKEDNQLDQTLPTTPSYGRQEERSYSDSIQTLCKGLEKSSVIYKSHFLKQTYLQILQNQYASGQQSPDVPKYCKYIEGVFGLIIYESVQRDNEAKQAVSHMYGQYQLREQSAQMKIAELTNEIAILKIQKDQLLKAFNVTISEPERKAKSEGAKIP